MNLTDQGNGMVMPVAPMNGGFGGGAGYMNGDWSFWLLILFLFAFMGNGWGGNGAGGGVTTINNDVQRGFDQSAVINGINGINAAVNSGFAGVESGAANRQMANMQQLFGMQTTLDGRLDSLAMSLQNCCCENRAAIADVKYAIANDGAATRMALSDGNQKILDKLCQLEMDGIKQNYENQLRTMQSTIDSLRGQVADARFDASQNAQTAAIQAGQRALANEVEQYVVPTPRPAWIVQNPSCCNQAMNGCCA